MRSRLIGFWLISVLTVTGFFTQAETAENFEPLFAASTETEQLDQLAQRLNMGDSAQGLFTQARYLKVLKKPLISQGEFFFQADSGLAWLQKTPFASGLILTQGKLIQIDSENRRQVTQASDNQQASGLAQMMPALMSALLQGQLAPLTEQFSVHLLQDEQAWQLGLIPLDPLLAKGIQGLVLQGDMQINRLTLLNQNGDRSQINFEQINNTPLTPTQLAYFSE